MRSISPLPSLLLLLFTLLSSATFAQPSPPTPSPSQLPSAYSTACSKCIIDAAIKLSPLCALESSTTMPAPHTLTDTQKSCYCPLTTSDTWILPCVKPDLCNAIGVNVLFREFAALRSFACPSSSSFILSRTPTKTTTASTARVSDLGSDFYPYMPTRPSGPFPPVQPTGDSPPSGSGATNGSVKKSGMKGLAAAESIVVVCFTVVGAVGALF